MKSIISFISTFCILITPIFSQAEYVDVGQNAYGISGMYQSESESDGNTTTMGGQFSYVFEGILDVGVEYAMSNYSDDEDSDFDSKASGISFGGHYHIKTPSIPFNIKVGGYYGTMSMDSDLLDDLEWTVKGKMSGFGGGVYKTIVQNDKYSLMPFANFNSITTEATVEDSYGDSESYDDDFTSISFGLSMKLTNNIWIAPTIGQVDGESELSLQFGIVFIQ